MTEISNLRLSSMSLEPIPFNPPKRTNLMLTKWCRISWYGQTVGPAFRFHLVIGGPGGPDLWIKLFRLDTAFHHYTDDGYPRKVFPWMDR